MTSPIESNSNNASSTHSSFVIGAFIVGAIALAFIALLFFSGGRIFTHKERVIMYFVGSVQGLQIGAPIKLKGVVLGEITDIQINFQNDDKKVTTPETMITAVTADLVMKRINRQGANAKGEFFNEAIQNGLRAQLNFQSFLTGLLYVELDFYPDTPVTLYKLQDEYRELPTIVTGIEEIFKSLQDMNLKGLVKNLDHLATQATVIVDSGVIQKTLADFSRATNSVENTSNQFNQLSKKLDLTLKQADIFLQQLNTQTPQVTASFTKSMTDFQHSLEQFNQASGSIKNSFSEDAPLINQLSSTLDDMGRAAQAFRSLSETLEQQPESVLRGKKLTDKEH
jgi:paraquat-inducible protein B